MSSITSALEWLLMGFLLKPYLIQEKFPERTVEAIRKQIERLDSNVRTKVLRIVRTIEPAPDALSMEEVVKLFSTAFKQICELQEVDKLTLERLRIIFQAAKDYGPLLSSFQRWEEIEKRVEELAAAVAELQAAKSAKKA